MRRSPPNRNGYAEHTGGWPTRLTSRPPRQIVAPAEDCPHRGDQFLACFDLQDVSPDSRLHRAGNELRLIVRGEQDDGSAQPFLENLPARVDAVQPRHVDVRDYGIRP